jgi:hypothetical protein
MITEPTVLILGAGASYPYEFPTAKELKGLICETFSNPNTVGSRLIGDHSEHSRDEVFGFREAFLKAGQPSVDAFLERRPNFLDVGKLAIAYCLIRFEEEALLYRPNPKRGGDWYEYMSSKLNSSYENFALNQLSIITFNYDRSLEHYLLTALVNLHGRPREECAESLAEIPIIHVYGQLGKTPYPQFGCRPYRPDRESFANISAAAAGITLLHEQSSDIQEVRQVLMDAKLICFLGLGYHQMNLARLAIDTKNAGSKRIFGTAKGLLGDELNDASERIHKILGSKPKLADADSLDLLRSHLVLG